MLREAIETRLSREAVRVVKSFNLYFHNSVDRETLLSEEIAFFDGMYDIYEFQFTHTISPVAILRTAAITNLPPKEIEYFENYIKKHYGDS